MRVVHRLVMIVAALAGLGITWRALGDPYWPLVLFTVQSNLILVAYNLWRPPSIAVKGAVTLYIAMTGLVWHFLLVRGANPFARVGSGGLGDFLLHYVTPALAVVDWFAFDRERRTPRWTLAVAWLAYPAAYVVFALVRGALLPAEAGRRYPYRFLDVDRYGYGGVALMVGALALGFFVLGWALLWLRRPNPAGHPT
ncbi:MAG: Pr6Pr family membrane protein [Nonomuraea sp.]|nr:Pr6Pr family membrane protein [Nonomuraea sp.]